ncbi:MAG: PTS sugar transporter subunit IIA [Desulfobacterales bacterium]
MKLIDYLNQDLIFVGVKADNKAGMLALLAEQVVKRYSGVNADELRSKLLAREEAGSTGIGYGVAVPHATVGGLPQTVCMVVCTAEAIDFDAIDNTPVHIIFLLVSPPWETGLHIKLLARIARLIKSGVILKTVSPAMSPKEVYDLIAREDSRHVE